jgi:hypothetical protein
MIVENIYKKAAINHEVVALSCHTFGILYLLHPNLL